MAIDMNFAMMVISTVGMFFVLLALKIKHRIKTGTVNFRVLCILIFSLMMFIDTTIYLAGVIDWEFLFLVVAMPACVIVGTLTWDYMLKIIHKEQSEANSKSQKLLDVLGKVQQAANQLSSSSEELAST